VVSLRNEASGAGVVLSAGSNGLGAVRSLDEAGVATVVVALDEREPALLSRFPARKLVVATSLDEDAPLCDALLSFGGGGEVLVPTSDKFVAFLGRNRARLSERFAVALPPDDLAARLIDKSVETALIEGLGVPIPRTCQDLPAQPEALLAALALPVIVKPRSFRSASLLGKNRILRTIADVERLYAEHGASLGQLLAQEVIPGPDETLWVCNCTFDRDHELASAFVFQRLRTCPAHYGVTSYALSQSNDAVLDLVRRIGRGLRYVGPAMVEFKHDRRDDTYRYIELNPRIGMCNYFDTRCGVNNVLNAYRIARGEEPVRAVGAQRDGVVYLSPYEDLYARYKDGEPITRALRHYVSNLGKPHVDVHLHTSDMRPWAVLAMRDLRAIARGMSRKALRRAVRVAAEAKAAGLRRAAGLATASARRILPGATHDAIAG
jgi:D-aspartate ligase